MAGNNAIQVLRGTITNTNKNETLLDGQVFYNMAENYITVGGGGQ